jgi:hypothetical protein
MRTIVRVDESAFDPLPAVVRAWARRGETPVLHAPLTREHLSVISGITPADQLLLQMWERSLRCADVVRFLWVGNAVPGLKTTTLPAMPGSRAGRGYRSLQ